MQSQENPANDLIEQQTRETMAENQHKLDAISKESLQIIKSQSAPNWGVTQNPIGKEPTNGGIGS